MSDSLYKIPVGFMRQKIPIYDPYDSKFVVINRIPDQKELKKFVVQNPLLAGQKELKNGGRRTKLSC